MTEDLRLAIVLGAAAIDAINPCAIGVLLFLASVLLRVSRERRRLLQLGCVYIATVYIVYTLSGLGLIWFQHALIERGYARIIGIAVGLLVIAMGLIALKEAFGYGRGISLEIAPGQRARLARLAQRVSFPGIVALGGFVALVELPCTGGPYLAVTALLAQSWDARALAYLLTYNAVFVAPLVLLLLLIYQGMATHKLKRWRQDRRWLMHLASGLLMLTLGAFLFARDRMHG